jgi:hypothetical protein
MHARSRCSARSVFHPHESCHSDADASVGRIEERMEHLAAQVRQAFSHHQQYSVAIMLSYVCVIPQLTL